MFLHNTLQIDLIKLVVQLFGNLSNIQVSLHALDIGVAQLGMHSSYETCGIKDTGYMVTALKEFFSTNIKIDCADGVIFE